MYGYVKQPDGVLKPILLKNIKNIVVSGNSLDIVYFSVGTTPLEVPKVDQQTYFDSGVVKACSEVSPGVFTNDIYNFGDTDFVNSDIKINFGDTPLDIYEVFTKWMNSILSGKVAATTDKTLNEYAPSLPVGYVFSNESSLPTAMLQKVETDGNPCDVELSIAQSQTVFVAADMVANSVPPIGTHLYQALFEDSTLSVSLAPIAEDGTYILYQFIAPTQEVDFSGIGVPQPACLSGPGGTAINIYDNLLSILDDVKYTVTIRNSAITSVTVCPESIQVEFSPLKQAQAYSYTNCEAEPGVWPTANSNLGELECAEFGGGCLTPGDNYTFSEYWVRQESNDAVPGIAQPGLGSFFDETVSNLNLAQAQQFVATSDVSDINADSIIVPTTNTDLSYPARIYSSVLDGTATPEFGLTGINMSILEIPEVPNPTYPSQGTNGYGPTYQSGRVMNGVPVVLGNKFRLANSAGDSQNSNYVTEPMHWDQGAPSFAFLPGPNGSDTGLQIRNFSYQEILLPQPGGFTFRGRFLHRPSTWQQIFSPNNGQTGEPDSPNGVFNNTYYAALQQAGVIPTGEAQFQQPLAHNIKVWFRDKTTDPKTGEQTVGEWTEFTPALQVATGLPFGMVNNVQLPDNPMTEPFNIAKDMMTVPFLVPETEKVLLDAGFTHRAFGVGSFSGFKPNPTSRTITINNPFAGDQNVTIFELVDENANGRSIKGRFRGWKYEDNSDSFIGGSPWSWDVINFAQGACDGSNES